MVDCCLRANQRRRICKARWTTYSIIRTWGRSLPNELIQHLVTSNPSPAYIQRVASAFNDNGSGVRGDMKAVITAILMDPEARRGDDPATAVGTDGHLQEPILYMTGCCGLSEL